MIKEKEQFEMQLNLIGYLLKYTNDMDKLSINKDYLKDFKLKGKLYNIRYIFKKMEQIHKNGRDDELVTLLMSDENIDSDILIEAVTSKT